MKILLASSSSGSRGGGEIFLRELAHAFYQHSHEVIYWCSSDQRMDDLAKSVEPVAQVIRQDYRNTYDRSMRNISAYADHPTARAVAACWRSLEPTIVLINKQNLEDGLDLLRAAREARLPAVAVIHITQSARALGAVGGRIRDAVSRLGLRAFPGPLVATEQPRMEDLLQLTKRPKGTKRGIHLLTNGVRDWRWAAQEKEAARRQLRERYGWPEATPVVLTVGRVMPQKRPDLWLRLVKEVSRKCPQHRFVWLGSGQGEEGFDQQVSVMGLDKIVRREPWVSQVAAWYNASDVFFHTALYEGSPLAVLEALGAGLPVLMCADLARQLPMLDGAVANFKDGKELAARLLVGADLEALSKAARERYEASYSLDQAVQQYEGLFRLVLEEAS